MSTSRLREYIFRIILATPLSEDENCVVEKASEAGTSYFHMVFHRESQDQYHCVVQQLTRCFVGSPLLRFFSLVPTQETAPAGAFRQTDTRQSAQPDWAQVSLSCVIGHGGMTLPALPLMTDSLSLFFLPSKNPPKCVISHHHTDLFTILIAFPANLVVELPHVNTDYLI